MKRIIDLDFFYPRTYEINYSDSAFRDMVSNWTFQQILDFIHDEPPLKVTQERGLFSTTHFKDSLNNKGELVHVYLMASYRGLKYALVEVEDS